MSDEIKVSIICNTYNHASYIRDALDGFIMQKTNFAYEVLVHDDASTDGTQDIIREYEEKYPETIKPVYQKENQYSQKIPYAKLYQYPRVKGKYIAFCEGDDYWTDEYKLQKQYDALESHPEVDMCAHTANRVNAETREVLGVIKPSEKDCLLSVGEVIAGGGGFVATNSLMYRREIGLNKQPEFREILRLDYTLQIHGSLRGGMLYLKDNMSDYRVMAKGSWSERMRKNRSTIVAHRQKGIEMLNSLNVYTNHEYESEVQKKILEYEVDIAEAENRHKDLLSKKYREIFKQYPLKERIKIRIKAYFPWLLKLKQRSK